MISMYSQIAPPRPMSMLDACFGPLSAAASSYRSGLTSRTSTDLILPLQLGQYIFTTTLRVRPVAAARQAMEPARARARRMTP